MKIKEKIKLIIMLIIGVLIGKFALSGSEKPSLKKLSNKEETVQEHWTCSMHPQIDMPEPGKCPICGMDLIPKKVTDINSSANSFKMTKNAIALANIQTIKIGDKSGVTANESTLKVSGKIVENANQSAVQTAHFGGRIEKLYYKSGGEYVKKGSVIARFYSPELVTAQNEFIQALEIKKEQPELYLAVRNKLKNWKISEKQIQQIEQNKKAITNFNLYANVNGYITKIMVEEGNHVKEGATLFNVSNLSSVWANLDIYEKDIAKIKKGTPILIKLNAFPDKEIKTKIDFIDPLLNLKTRTAIARATLNNKNNFLKPGMILVAQAEIKNNQKQNKSTIVIPKSAVLWTGKRSIVYVKKNKDNPIFTLREVTLGQETGDNYQIVSGLNTGDEVVVNGTFTVDATAQLLGKKSMMNKE